MISENELKQWTKQVIGAIKLLSLPYEEQIKQFPEFIPVADEIALIFNDEAAIRLDVLFENGYLEEEDYNDLKKLDYLLDEMSGSQNIELWSLEALKSSKEWKVCREYARKVLLRLKKE